MFSGLRLSYGDRYGKGICILRQGGRRLRPHTQRFKRLRDAKMALRMYRDKHPATGERYTLARLVDVVGRFSVDKVYNW